MKKYTPIMEIRVKKVSYLTEKPAISSPESIISIMAPLFKDLDREHFKIVLLDGANKIIGINTISIGTINKADIYMREIFKMALLCNASGIILTHNHPAGNTKPSSQDENITEKITESGVIFGISVLDHIIFGEKAAYSMTGEVSYPLPQNKGKEKQNV